MDADAPDVVLLGASWRERTLLRAQLIEEGYDVVAIDAWPMPAPSRRPGMAPRLVIVDLYDLPRPRETLDEIASAVPAARVLVLTALGTMTADEVRARGFSVIQRPAAISEIVARAAEMLSRGG